MPLEDVALLNRVRIARVTWFEDIDKANLAHAVAFRCKPSDPYRDAERVVLSDQTLIQQRIDRGEWSTASARWDPETNDWVRTNLIDFIEPIVDQLLFDPA